MKNITPSSFNTHSKLQMFTLYCPKHCFHSCKYTEVILWLDSPINVWIYTFIAVHNGEEHTLSILNTQLMANVYSVLATSLFSQNSSNGLLIYLQSTLKTFVDIRWYGSSIKKFTKSQNHSMRL